MVNNVLKVSHYFHNIPLIVVVLKTFLSLSLDWTNLNFAFEHDWPDTSMTNTWSKHILNFKLNFNQLWGMI